MDLRSPLLLAALASPCLRAQEPPPESARSEMLVPVEVTTTGAEGTVGAKIRAGDLAALRDTTSTTAQRLTIAADNRTGEGTPLASKIFMLHAGAVGFSPRTVKQGADGRWELASKDSGEQTQGYVEAYFRNRCAWLNGRSLANENGRSTDGKASGWWVPKDQTARIGFTFAKSDSEDDTTVSATTLVGSGRFYAEASFGWPLGFLSVCAPDQPFNHTINLELRGGWVTDPDQHQLHSHYMLGLTSVWGFFATDSTQIDYRKDRRIELLMGIDAGISEFPSIDTVEADRTIVRREGGDIRFSRRGAFGLRAEINIPIADTGYLVIAGRAFDTFTRPYNEAEWNLTVGFAVPFGFFVK
ncbi:MAG: hypothetical protein R3F56_00460 [Planctomycetota bacterium]